MDYIFEEIRDGFSEGVKAGVWVIFFFSGIGSVFYVVYKFLSFLGIL